MVKSFISTHPPGPRKEDVRGASAFSDLVVLQHSAEAVLSQKCSWRSPGLVLFPCLLVAVFGGTALVLQLFWATRPPPHMLHNADEAAGVEPSLSEVGSGALASPEAAKQAVSAEVVRTVGCYLAVLDSIIFTLVIPDSFDLVSALGGNAVLSGAMIGIQKLGNSIGAVAFWGALRVAPDIWRTRARGALTLCALCQCIGTGSYGFVAAAADSATASPSHARLLLAALFLGRIVGGVGAGIRLMSIRTCLARLTPGPDRPHQQSRFLFAIMLGMGAGPLVACAVKALNMCQGHRTPFLPAGIAGLTLSLCELAAARCVRSLDGAADFLGAEEGRVMLLEERELDRRRSLIVCALAYSVLRCLCVSGVEAASALLLEVSFGWSPFYVGLTIGLAFLTCIPWRLAYLRLSHRLPLAQWILVLLGASVLGSVLLFRPPMPTFASRGLSRDARMGVLAGALLVGDGLLFPCFFLSDSLVQGVILQHPLPAKASWLNLNGINLFNSLFLDGFARVLGPALSRFHVSAHGQNTYAGQQLALTLVAGLIAVIGINPRLREVGKDEKPQHSPSNAEPRTSGG